MQHRNTVDKERFAFGANWQRYLATVTEVQVAVAVESLRARLQVPNLNGRSFVDIGSGSGLFSLAARQLGAIVRSFDYDIQSVECTRWLRDRFATDDSLWRIEQGSILDSSYLSTLGQFDVVYSWGVLHHTGDLWQALENSANLVKPDGFLFVAIYNNQGWISRYWSIVKWLYNRGAMLRFLVTAIHFPYLYLGRLLARRLRGIRVERGMSLWYDMHDWLGGYPFEVATPGEVIEYCRQRGFLLQQITTCGSRHGCNEFVFVKKHSTPHG